METLLPAHASSEFSFGFMAPPKLPNPLVHMEQVKLGYDHKVILEQVKLNLVPGSRIGLLGRNGAGKSTLIKLLAGEKSPMSGEYQTSAGLRVGYFAQHQLEYLRADDTPLNHLQRLDNKATEQQLRDFLGGFGFHGDAALSKVAPMSGGEKARLVLALIVYQKPNLLLLDEPTNHLDLEMRHALNIALQGFTGAMLLVSHDRFLLSSVCDEFYLVDNGHVASFDGDLDDYRNWLMTAQSQDDPVEDKPKGLDRKQQKRLEAEFRQSTQGIRKDIEKQESLMHKCEKELARIEAQLTDNSLYEAENKEQLKTLLTNQAELSAQAEKAEMTWLDGQEKLELMQQEFNAKLQSQF